MLPKLLDPRPYFADLPDPRRETRNKLHKLHDILMIVFCAVLGGILVVDDSTLDKPQGILGHERSEHDGADPNPFRRSCLEHRTPSSWDQAVLWCGTRSGPCRPCPT